MLMHQGAGLELLTVGRYIAEFGVLKLEESKELLPAVFVELPELCRVVQRRTDIRDDEPSHAHVKNFAASVRQFLVDP